MKDKYGNEIQVGGEIVHVARYCHRFVPRLGTVLEIVTKDVYSRYGTPYKKTYLKYMDSAGVTYRAENLSRVLVIR